MANLPELNEINLDDIPDTKKIIAHFDPDNPNAIVTIEGESSILYKGAMEIEWTWSESNKMFTVKARRYKFDKTVTGKNSKFEIMADGLTGPILAIIPYQNSQWNVWDSSGNYPAPQRFRILAFYVRFHNVSDGISHGDIKYLVINA